MKRKIKMICGQKNLLHVLNGSKVLGVEKAFKHPSHDPSTHAYDIALIKLNETVDYTPEIAPICLPDSSTTSTMRLVGQTAIIAGYTVILKKFYFIL